MKDITIYTDGSSRGNPGPGGYGTLLIYQGHRKELSGGFAKTTNNRMEILAALTGLESLREPCRITVYSDSKYVIDAMDKGWIHGWKKKGWSRGPNKPLKNADLWKRMSAAVQGHKVSWKWVKGHAGHPENERCDALATNAADQRGNPVDRGFVEGDA
ncbi:ribonuclease HI [Verrucomicrobiaceae bacterium R5-34]|uniref:Ribonuclease H n=2 Tax=Oceaniferula flava TaxID=2800421 RepID=A0AAE2VD48_9BACT|nr:ribonuclease HI [Verrucomicrobiaceae bacterium R5-34]MBK1855716.1 ribonuclease HI [Oceaniferula flavus]MBM1137023.1 ribonuclease HI [Oceaniferula flavus]